MQIFVVLSNNSWHLNIKLGHDVVNSTEYKSKNRSKHCTKESREECSYHHDWRKIRNDIQSPDNKESV